MPQVACSATANRAAVSRRASVVVRAQTVPVPRRAALAALLGATAAAAAAPRPAAARDYKEALAE